MHARAFGKSRSTQNFGIVSTMTGGPEREGRRITAKARKKLSKTAEFEATFPHRCTKCGLFDPQDLETTKQGYRWHFVGRLWRSLLMCCFAAVFLAPFCYVMWLVYIKESSRPGGISENVWIGPAIVSPFLFGGLVLAVFAYRWRPMSRRRFYAEVEAANDPERMQAWLENFREQQCLYNLFLGRGKAPVKRFLGLKVGADLNQLPDSGIWALVSERVLHFGDAWYWNARPRSTCINLTPSSSP
ncbi:MAG: hypothetical protein ISS69_02710 [Phycisphaerae bacterium]|nr:hypothetical protein [Planctomycetota bacterium]MBL7219000.1 hypothetical protein [Phycisphaerae bacterium]